MHVMLGDGVELGQLVVDDLRKVYVLHRVLYPQVHDNGLKKKKKPRFPTQRSVLNPWADHRFIWSQGMITA